MTTITWSRVGIHDSQGQTHSSRRVTLPGMPLDMVPDGEREPIVTPPIRRTCAHDGCRERVRHDSASGVCADHLHGDACGCVRCANG